MQPPPQGERYTIPVDLRLVDPRYQQQMHQGMPVYQRPIQGPPAGYMSVHMNRPPEGATVIYGPPPPGSVPFGFRAPIMYGRPPPMIMDPRYVQQPDPRLMPMPMDPRFMRPPNPPNGTYQMTHPLPIMRPAGPTNSQPPSQSSQRHGQYHQQGPPPPPSDYRNPE